MIRRLAVPLAVLAIALAGCGGDDGGNGGGGSSGGDGQTIGPPTTERRKDAHEGGKASLVPTVVGIDISKAEAILTRDGFLLTISSVPSDASAGTVIEQDPLPGSQVQPGAPVILTVSSGPP